MHTESASIERPAIPIALSSSFLAWSSANVVILVINCVPLIRANPSLASSSMGVQPFSWLGELQPRTINLP